MKGESGMTNSVESLKILMDTFGEGWKDRLSYYFRGQGEFKPEEKQCLADFFNAYREDFIGNRLFNLAGVEKLIDSEMLNSEIENYVDDLLNLYYETEALRKLEAEEPVKVKAAADFIFEQVILRYNSEFAESYNKYDFPDKEEFETAARALDSLCTYVVSENFYKTTIVDVVYNNTRLSKELCRHIGNKIDENFVALQRKLLVGKLYEIMS